MLFVVGIPIPGFEDEMKFAMIIDNEPVCQAEVILKIRARYTLFFKNTEAQIHQELES